MYARTTRSPRSRALFGQTSMMSTTGAPSLAGQAQAEHPRSGDRRSEFSQDEPSRLGESEDRGLHRIATRTRTSTDDHRALVGRVHRLHRIQPHRLQGTAGGRPQPGQLQPNRQQGRGGRPPDGDRAPRACLWSHARGDAALRAHQRAQPDRRSRHLRSPRRLALQRAARAAHAATPPPSRSMPSSPRGRPTGSGMRRSSRSSSPC